MPAARSMSVPKALQPTYAAVTALTDSICDAHLNADYRELARSMTAALCRRRPSPLLSGQARTWACGIVHLLGQLNFLSDRSNLPFMTMAQLCAAFGVGQSTASAKAKLISETLRTHRMDATWMLRSHVDANPLIWFATVNGLMVDLRDMPREVQEIAFDKGIIPYIPDDRE